MTQLNKVHNVDCLEFMKKLPDDYFDLVLTDPPYGIGMDVWDEKTPNKEVFDEIFRVSKNQIIFGGNYFELPKTNAWIVWYKRPFLEGQSEAELVWTSFDMNIKVFDYLYAGNCEGNPNNPKVNYKKKAVHKAEKPVAVGRWLLKFAKKGDLIFDPFAGSGSFLVACKQLGFNFVGCEINPKYCSIINKRLNQSTVFEFTSKPSVLTLPSAKAINIGLKENLGDFPKSNPTDLTSLNQDIMRNLNFCSGG